MAVTPAAQKKIRTDKRRTVHNLRRKRTMKEAIKNLEKAVSAGNIEEAKEMLPDVYKAIDKAAKQNIIHKNNAGRKKSRMQRLVSEAQA